jgi:hypothetical protein
VFFSDSGFVKSTLRANSSGALAVIMDKLSEAKLVRKLFKKEKKELLLTTSLLLQTASWVAQRASTLERCDRIMVLSAFAKVSLVAQRLL